MDMFYKLFGGLRTALCAAAVLMTAMAPLSAQAAEDSIFTVTDVKVDVTAADAMKAREQAFTQAQQAAFQKLAEQVLAEDEMASFQMPDVSVISPMIKDFEITEEHLSSVRYVGTYTFRFEGGRVQSFFNKKGVTYTDVKSRPVLILPFYQEGSRSILWGDNPWLQAWTRSAPSRGLVPVVVPIGDVQDVSDIGDNDALSYDQSALQAMLARYNAGGAIIAVASPDSTTANAAGLPSGLTIAVYRSSGGEAQKQDIVQVSGDSGNLDGLFDTAVQQVRQTLQKDWKNLTAVNPAETNNLKARILFTTMPEWIETQKVLRTVPGVQEVKLLSLRPGEAEIELRFSGGEDRLRLALSQAAVTLTAPQVNFGGGYDDGADGGRVLSYDLYLDKYAPNKPYAGQQAQPVSQPGRPY